METLKTANLSLAFLLELCALGALGRWGVQTGQSPVTKAILGLGAPLVMATVWGVFLSPRAAMPLEPSRRLLLKLLVFALAVLALVSSGRPTWGWILAAAVVINAALAVAWNQ